MTCFYWGLIADTRNVQNFTDSCDITALIETSLSWFQSLKEHTWPRIFLDFAAIFRYLELKFFAVNVIVKPPGSLSTDVSEPRTSTGSRNFSSSTRIYVLENVMLYAKMKALQLFGRALKHAERKNINFRLTSVVQWRLCFIKLSIFTELSRSQKQDEKGFKNNAMYLAQFVQYLIFQIFFSLYHTLFL